MVEGGLQDTSQYLLQSCVYELVFSLCSLWRDCVCHLLGYSVKSQLNVDPRLCTGLHKWYSTFLQWKRQQNNFELSASGMKFL